MELNKAVFQKYLHASCVKAYTVVIYRYFPLHIDGKTFTVACEHRMQEWFLKSTELTFICKE